MFNGAFRDGNTSMYIEVDGQKHLLRLESVSDVDYALETVVWAHRKHPTDVSYTFFRSACNVLLDRRNVLAPRESITI